MQVDFSDGARIHQDPRREDSLVYYLPTGTWGHAIGIEILPLYEEHQAASVRIHFWNDHLGRLQALDAAELALIMQRFAHVLSQQFTHWTNLTTEWPDWLVERVGQHALAQPFVDAGWHAQSQESPSTRQWKREVHCDEG